MQLKCGPRLVCTLLCSLVLASSSAAFAIDLDRSDVFWKRLDTGYLDYPGTGVAYLNPPDFTNPGGLVSYNNLVAAYNTAGLKTIGRIYLDADYQHITNYANQLGQDPWDHAVLDVNGDPNPYGWRPGVIRYDSQSWLVKDAMKRRIEVAIDAGVDMIMVDLQSANYEGAFWHGGCFSTHCKEDFRVYLDSEYTTSELASMGISDINSFDYGQFLQNRGWTNQSGMSFQSQQGEDSTIPLWDDYRRHQHITVNDLHQELAGHADAYSGGAVTFLTSNDPYNAFGSTFIPEVDHYLEEIESASATDVSNDIVMNLKIADYFGKRAITTPGPTAWSGIYQNGAEDLVRTWIAQTYAHGGNFMVPIRQWVWGSNYYVPNPTDQFVPSYDFVKDKAVLFEGYEEYSNIGLLYSQLGRRHGQVNGGGFIGSDDSFYDTFNSLVENNIPFKLVFAGDDWMGDPLTAGELASYDALITHSDDSHLNSTQQALFAAEAAKTVAWPDNPPGNPGATNVAIQSLDGILDRQIDVSIGNDLVAVVTRRNLTNTVSPYVFHLLNKDYDSAQKAVNSHGSFTIDLSDTLFDVPIQSAMYHRPGLDSIPVNLSQTGNTLTVDVPGLAGAWGIIEFRATSIPGDFNGDGNVDGTDFLMWQRGEASNPTSGLDLADWESNYGGTASPDPKDPPSSTIVHQHSFMGVDEFIVRSGYSVPSLDAAAAVPEPTTTMLLLIAGSLAAPTARSRQL